MAAAPSDRRRERLVLTGCVLGIFLAATEGTIVGTVMPTIVADLGGLAKYPWVFSVYMLASSVTMPIWGKLADLFGPRRLFAVGVPLFLIGSALAGLSPTMEHLIAVRVVQGAGAGSLFALPLTILAHQFPPERRGHMLGFAAGTWGLAALLGPPVGALVVSLLDWRWVFFLAIPFGLTGLALVHRYAVEAPRGERVHVDVTGALVLVLLVVSLLLGTQALREGSAVLGLTALPWLLLAAALLPLLLVVEARAKDPVIPLGLFHYPLYRVANAGAFLMAFCVFCAMIYVPLLTTLNDPTQVARAGLSLVPASLGWATGATLGGRIVNRTGPRALAAGGALLAALGFLAATRLGPDSTLAQIVPTMLPIGLGMGLTSAPILVSLQNHLGAARLGTVTSGVAFYRHLGGSMGVALLGALIPTGPVAVVAAGAQRVFLAAALILVPAALLLTRLPASILPAKAAPVVKAAAHLAPAREPEP